MTPAKPKLSRNSVSTTILIAPEQVDESEQSESIPETNQNDKHLTEMIQTTILKLNNQVIFSKKYWGVKLFLANYRNTNKYYRQICERLFWWLY